MKFRVLLASLLLIPILAMAQEKPTSEDLYQEAYDNFVKRDYTAASASLDKINPVDQKKADILNLRGAIYKRLGELDNAANAYTDALKINPKDWVPKYNLAEVNFLQEQYKPARTYLEQALASMPEADRLQKQDLILYKVYLTYLLQGDDEKAKLLLDSFDINSSNPVYYFAQAAWSYKKKDGDKAKTWINSTDGLYSQDLRNSYGQALVDVGWLEPAAGVGTTSLTASNASPTPAPEATATPDTASSAQTAVVPLASNDAAPIPVMETAATATPSPTMTPDATPVATVPVLPATEEKKSEDGSSSTKIALIILALLAVAIWLINLAKRSRIVPPPEDNTGYDAIVASGKPEVAGSITHSSEGTGIVLEQDDEGNPIVPTAIKVTPIHREYAADDTEVTSVASDVPTVRLAAATASQANRSKPSPKSVVTSKTKELAPVKKAPAKAPVKASPTKTAPAKAAPIVATKVPAAVPAKANTKTPAAPVTKSPTGKTSKPAAKPATKTTATKPVTKAPIIAPAAVAPAPVAAAKPAPKSSETAAKPAAKSTSASAKPTAEPAVAAPRRTRLISVPTIDVPPPATPAPKILVSNIETIKLSDIKSEAPAPVSKPAAAPAKPKAPAKPAVAAKPKTPAKPAAKPAIKSTAPLITIPEFEDSNLETNPSTTIRLVPEPIKNDDEPQNG